jgi:molecular chaperone GrpE
MDKKKQNITLEDETKNNTNPEMEKEINNTEEQKDVNEVQQEQTDKETSGKSKSAKSKSSKKKKAQGNKEVEELKTKLDDANDKYLRLSAEYDNYRKRTLKEKMDLVKTGGQDVLVNILPVINDFDRAMKSMDEVTDCKAMKEGIDLIYNKFIEFLKSRGVKEIEAINQDFDTDLHEALTKIPAPDKKLKGKVVDVIEKGYYLNDKVIRFAKVVVGE